jgi:hypothetical protein
LLLDDGDARAELRRANRANIAAGARTDHHEVKLSLFVRHCLLLRRGYGVHLIALVAHAASRGQIGA